MNLICVVSLGGFLFFTVYNMADICEHKKVVDEISKLKRKVMDEKTNTIDFAELYKTNHDIVAWITIPDTFVNYPVVMAKENNDYYLTHDVTKKYSKYGSIYTDSRLYGSPFDSWNCLIYGHNMGKYSNEMFSNLIKYKDKKFYKKHKYIRIYRRKESADYQIVSIREVTDSDEAYRVEFDNTDEFSRWLKKSIEASEIKCDPVNDDEITNVVTLSTCTYENRRLVIVCEYEKRR